MEIILSEKVKKLATVLFLLLPLFSYAEGIYDLRTEHLREPMGMDAANPRFSWKMETAGRFRKEFKVRGRITKARAYIATAGLHTIALH
ncbi:MAG: hypothetical protein MJY55_00200 [Bacteroidales bacterium]|nr:hypothetical protein [Bacteroidales bacterium]